MSMNIDKSLDDIITTKKRSRGPRRGGANAGQRTPSGAQQAAAPAPATGGKGRNQQQAAAAAPAPSFGLQGLVGDKIVVSGLPDDVTEAQVKELFTSTVGPISYANLTYNHLGKSKGIATVQFKRATDAAKAFETYNGRLVDGKRPMKVEIVYDPSKAPLAARLGAAPSAPTGPKVASATVAAAGGSARQPRNPTTGGGRGGRGGGRAPRAPQRPKATLESLDAEMSDWQASASSAAAAPAETTA